MKTIALIPLRAGSKGIPKKNIRLIAGKPLCAWVIEAAVGCQFIDEVFVSTESQEIEAVVDSLGVNVQVINRPVEYASDEASTESVMLHFMSEIDFDDLVTIQATSPLLNSTHLKSAFEEYRAKKLDSMLSAVRTKRFFWNDNDEPTNYDPLHRPRRQDFKGTLMENGAFYITKRKILDELGCRLGGKVGVFEMPESTAIEIDEQNDWDIVAKLLNR